MLEKVREKGVWLQEWAAGKTGMMKSLFVSWVTAIMTVVSGVVAFAADDTVSGVDLSGVAITESMLKPLIEGVVANIAVILPVGVTIFGIMLGVTLVPKLIKKFF